MANGKFVAYYRVSTGRQGASGLGLEAQQKAVRDWLDGGRWKLIDEYTEVESGKRSDRPKLREALAAAKRAKATLIVGKLDRLARNVLFTAQLMESGVDFIAVDNPHANKLTIHILAAMAEYERDQISSRTKAALAQAQARGVKLGGPRIREVAEQGRLVQVERADQFAANVLPLVRELQAGGVTTLKGISEALNLRGVPTARGGRWFPQTVKQLLARA